MLQDHRNSTNFCTVVQEQDESNDKPLHSLHPCGVRPRCCWLPYTFHAERSALLEEWVSPGHFPKDPRRPLQRTP